MLIRFTTETGMMLLIHHNQFDSLSVRHGRVNVIYFARGRLHSVGVTETVDEITAIINSVHGSIRQG